MPSNWLEDDDSDMAMARSTFVQRAQNAPDDDDMMQDDIRRTIMLQDDAEETSLQQLIRHWVNERQAPDILPAQEMLLGRLLDHIRKQSDDVQLLRADPDTLEDEHFRIMLVQTEVERVKFIIRSYIRTRLHKIEKFARYINATPDIHERLSQGELEHAQRYATLLESHFTNSVLQSLPEEQRGMNDTMVFQPSMITKPNKQTPIFVRARQECPRVNLPDGSEMQMAKGDISLTPYYVVEQLLARGEVECV